MKKTWKIMLTFLVALTLLFGLTACGKKDDVADKDTTLNADGTTIEEGDPDYNVEDDLVECIVALPTQLFYTTGIPVCLWFLNRNKQLFI